MCDIMFSRHAEFHVRVLQEPDFDNDIVGFNDFLNENYKKIKSYKILNEAYNGTFEELLQDVMKRADLLGNMIGYAFFEMTDKSDKYNKLLRAMGLAAEIQGLVRGYIE